MNFIKKALLFCALVFGVISIAIGSAVYFYGDEMKAYAFDNLKQKLNKDIQIGETKFAGISHFPNIGLNITNLFSPGFNNKDTLLFAPEASLSFNLIDMLRGEIEIEKIELKNSSIHLARNKKGQTNFNFSGDKTDKEDSPSSFAFNKLRLVDVSFIYADEKTKTDVSIWFDDMAFKGKVNGDIIDIESDGSATVNRIYADGTEWANKKTNATTNAKIRYNQAENSIHFIDSKISLEDNPIVVEGTIITLDQYSQYQLRFHSDKIQLSKSIPLIPNKFASIFQNYNSKGTAKLTCTLSGSDADGLVTEICFESDNATITVQDKNTHIKFSNINGCYTWNPDSKDELLNIKRFTAELDGETISGAVQIQDFDNPYLKISSNGTLNLETANRFLSIDTLEKASGNLILDMAFEGNFKKASTYKSNGKVKLDNVSLAFKNNPLLLKSFNGTFNLKNNDIEVNDFSGNLNTSDILINGLVTNLYDYLFLGDEQLQIDAKLTSTFLDLNTIWQSETKNNDTLFTLEFSEGLDVRLALNLNEFYFKKFEAKNVLGKVQLKEQVLSTKQLSMDAMDGSAIVKGKIDASQNEVEIFTESTVNKIDIHKLFFQVGNFGQDVVVYQNLKGLVTANIIFNSVWSKTLIADLDKIYVRSEFVIENGELNNFDPMLALSKYVKGTDLSHVAFSTLTNSIEIQNQKINFPLMEIKSSALDIIGSGTHTFDNDIDYNIQLLISQILGKKVKQQNTEFGEIEDDGLGRSKLFLTMTGTVDKPQFAIDKKALSNKIAQDIKEEKEELRKLLHTEFSKNKNEDRKDSQSTQNKANSTVSGFEIEDEEEDFEIIDD